MRLIFTKSAWLLTAIFLPSLVFAMGKVPDRALNVHDQRLSALSAEALSKSDRRFAPVYQEGAAACSVFRPPRLIRAAPLVDHLDARVVLDVLVTKQGDVGAVLIRQGNGLGADGQLQRIIQTWVFAPAVCDGQPMEAEGTIELPH